jgi:hypothetical protein
LDLDPEKSLEDQLHSTVDEVKEASDDITSIDGSNPNAPSHTIVDEPPIRDDPRFSKYFTMLKMVNHAAIPSSRVILDMHSFFC